MTTAAPPHRKPRRRATLAGTALATVAVVVTAILVSTSGAESAPSQTGNATHFAGFGSASAYGGCGLPQDVLDSQDFVALNVVDAPGDYSPLTRPVPPAEERRIGRWDNGRNCGRYVQVTIGNLCTGINDGAPGKPFCREGSWVADDVNGATLTMVVADGCADATAWCRDDPDHLGLSTTSLTRFTKNGVPVGHIAPDRWNNRHVSWSYVPTPHYTGDLELGFLRDSRAAQPLLAVSHLPNGIHGVEYQDPNGAWQRARPDGDRGQVFTLAPTSAGGTDYRIRVRDVSDALVNRGRVYRFGLPPACGSRCADVYTEIDYSTEEGVPTSDAWTTAPKATTTEPTTTVGTTTTQPVVAVPPAPVTTTPPAPTAPASGCTASYAVGASWRGAHQVEVSVRNTGRRPLSGWRVTFSVTGSQRFTTTWNASVSQSGKRVVATNQGYNGSLAPGAATTWGSVVSGVDDPVSGLGCEPR